MPRALEPLLELAGLPFELADTAGLDRLPPGIPRPDIAVNLHGRGPQSHAALLARQPRAIVAFANRVVGVDGPAWRADEHEVRRWCRMLTESGVPADPSRLYIDAPPASAHARPGATVIHPGAASRARRWPAERWAAVARWERERGRAVLLTGVAAERPLASAIAH